MDTEASVETATRRSAVAATAWLELARMGRPTVAERLVSPGRGVIVYSHRVHKRPAQLSAVDLFCGLGGLSYGLRKAGIEVTAGVDLDRSCRYPFERNIRGDFYCEDVADLSPARLADMWKPGTIRILAGCAPCQPFSPYRRGIDTTGERHWPLVDEVGRLVKATAPELVTMENVPRIAGTNVFQRFIATLRDLGYSIDHRSCYCPEYGVPQHRRRLVLVASRLGQISVPDGFVPQDAFITVHDAISELPPIADGQQHPDDPLHKSRKLSELNLKRIRASSQGGTWEEWEEALRAPCHRRATGATFRNVYARMAWREPAPTITTLAYNFGAGRFGHPVQDRPISLREAAILQSFPPDYEFVAPGEPVEFSPLGRLIGNAVPPLLAQAIGKTMVDHARAATDIREATAGNKPRSSAAR